jgi:hypothetical protein
MTNYNIFVTLAFSLLVLFGMFRFYEFKDQNIFRKLINGAKAYIYMTSNWSLSKDWVMAPSLNTLIPLFTGN